MPKFPSTSFPYLQQMDAVIQLEGALAGNQSIAAASLKLAIHTKQPAAAILKTVSDMAADNYNLTADLIGKKLTDKILSI